ncbi:hypothetical protein [Halorussus amylolyticus]|uniref:hypothetical protein n=1 Tax=Halorussus amylolyticus TaxID=1126242 RepID=UPI001045A0CD|nr:hypothetical protein [Halorussus amylolyticus]
MGRTNGDSGFWKVAVITVTVATFLVGAWMILWNNLVTATGLFVITTFGVLRLYSRDFRLWMDDNRYKVLVILLIDYLIALAGVAPLGW